MHFRGDHCCGGIFITALASILSCLVPELLTFAIIGTKFNAPVLPIFWLPVTLILCLLVSLYICFEGRQRRQIKSRFRCQEEMEVDQDIRGQSLSDQNEEGEQQDFESSTFDADENTSQMDQPGQERDENAELSFSSGSNSFVLDGKENDDKVSGDKEE